MGPAPTLVPPPHSYLQIYEYLLSRGADPTLLTDDFDPYLDPGRKTPADVAHAAGGTRAALAALDAKHAAIPKSRQPHRDVGDWWALYDYGAETVAAWPASFDPPYPEAATRARETAARRARRAARRAAAGAGDEGCSVAAVAAPAPARPAATNPAAPPPPLALATLSLDPLLRFTPAPGVAFLFPGQGAQAVGMLASSTHLPAVRAMLAAACDVLGYDLAALIAAGPQAKLDDTAVAQPALYVAGLAALERLRAEDPSLASSPAAMAGLSLGEYAALTAAGALAFEDGLRLVAARGAAMAEAAATPPPHGMLSIVGLDDAEVDAAVVAGRAAGGVCAVANRLFPGGRVLAGHAPALAAAGAAATAAGALKVARLPVAGGFHTELMAPAAAALRAALGKVVFKNPAVPVWSNVLGAPFPDATSIPALLEAQLTSPVLWQETLAGLVAAGSSGGATAARLVELGPGGQIRAMVKRVDAAAWAGMKSVAP